MGLTFGDVERISRLAWRVAHAAWDGGGGLERTSRPEADRYCPTKADVAASGLTTDAELDWFRAEFEDAARQIAAKQ